MSKLKSHWLMGSALALIAANAHAKNFSIPAGDLDEALGAYQAQSGVALMVPDDKVRGKITKGATGSYTELAALTKVLSGTGFTYSRDSSGIVAIVPQQEAPLQIAQVDKKSATSSSAASVETVVVTAQKKKEDIQQVPIAVTALSQKDLTERQIAAGPDLLRDVPNMNFTKTNFSGYDIELRGIGTQAISVTTDPAVAVAYNGTPFIRNHFFEQEFFDLDNVEVLRGPQGTLYGRNATAGVVNLIPALPTDQFEAMGSADFGNYMNRRLEGMINLPIAGDQLDIRVAGEWTKRNGYTLDTTLNQDVDGRDLWSGRVSIGFKPTANLQTYLIWEHFSEDDDRLRSGKQLCETSKPPTTVDGVAVPSPGSDTTYGGAFDPSSYLSQGCVAASLYSPQSFEVPYGAALPYVKAAELVGAIGGDVNPYAETTQSSNLRDIQSAILPHYRAKNDILEFNADYKVAPGLVLTSQTGWNSDSLYSTEDYNRFDTSPGLFASSLSQKNGTQDITNSTGVFCDPQLGCSSRLIAEDVSDETAWQFSQEMRLSSSFSGPFNFNVGANYLHYVTEENYYVFINALSLYTLASFPVPNVPYVPGMTDNTGCFFNYGYGYQPLNPKTHTSTPSQDQCNYIDPNPIGSVNNMGHNYFLSQNPYQLSSYAVFGETYYNVLSNLKLTTGLRFTDDQKSFTDIPSEVLTDGWGYYSTGVVNQRWDRLTGRAVLDWTPQLNFTDQTLVYGSYAHGYKAGGANPPGAALIGNASGNIQFPDHPLTFKPEYIEAFELGTKNTLLDGTLTVNGDIFYYNYTGYQISEIVDRTAINNNYNAHVEGAELESNWEPLPGLKFNFAGGWEATAAAAGSSGVDLIDRGNGNVDWLVVRPYPTQASNCILPSYVVAALLTDGSQGNVGLAEACGVAYNEHLDPITQLPYVANPSTSGGNVDGQGPLHIPVGYPGFNPYSAPNNGEGFSKALGGHALPNAPPFTVSLGAQYTVPVLQNWAATLRTDFYWQADSWARIFNDNPYDRLNGYTNVNFALILSSDDGWQIMGYVKNVFNTTAVTGDFLNSDDTGLTTNVFLTDPRLYGVRISKDFGASDTGATADIENWIARLFSDADNTKPSLWITLGGDAPFETAQGEPFVPPFVSNYPGSTAYKPTSIQNIEGPQSISYDKTAELTFAPDGSDWQVIASVRYGRSSRNRNVTDEAPSVRIHQYIYHNVYYQTPSKVNFSTTQSSRSQSHAIIDFEARKDVGIGLLAGGDQSSVGMGVRIAQFISKSSSTIHARPDLQHYNLATAYFKSLLSSPNLYFPGTRFHTFAATARAKRSFHGIGPRLSWNDSLPLMGNSDSALASIDWGANAAVLFGRRAMRGQQSISGHYDQDKYSTTAPHGRSHYYAHSTSFNRSKAIVVPNLGGFAGVSVSYRNAKVSIGYRGDFFFGAMDTGWDHAHGNNVGFFGPYAKISIGLGG